MKMLHALGLSIALLVGLWVYISIGMPDLGFYPWIGFVAWAAFYAAGGGRDGVFKPLAASTVAILLTALTMFAVGEAGGGLAAMIGLIAVLAFVLVVLSDVAVLSYTPAAFLGAPQRLVRVVVLGKTIQGQAISAQLRTITTVNRIINAGVLSQTHSTPYLNPHI